MQSVQSIAVINGRPTIWGDMSLALVRGSGLLESFAEAITDDGKGVLTATTTVMRKGDKTPIIGTFSTSDAKQAGLLNKPGPWTQYPKRMLQMRARSFALRDGFPDVLRGMCVREEAQDFVEMNRVEDGSYAVAAPNHEIKLGQLELLAKTGKRDSRHEMLEDLPRTDRKGTSFDPSIHQTGPQGFPLLDDNSNFVPIIQQEKSTAKRGGRATSSKTTQPSVMADAIPQGEPPQADDIPPIGDDSSDPY